MLTVCGAAAVPASAQRHASILERFLARGEEPPVEYRALRHLEARNAHFGVHGWIDAWTEFDRAHGFRYEIVAEGGSGYVRRRVLRAALDGEQKMWAAQEPQRASLAATNYVITDRGQTVEGLAVLGLEPRRKDVLLVDGSIFVEPTDAELKRIVGRLSKTPSFWTRNVEIVRRYERLAGVRVPVAFESTAHVLVAGTSTFAMTYEYEIVNGQRVGQPQRRSHPTRD